jgi:hypothetical protein
MQKALETALAELVLGEAIAESDELAIGAWLTRNQLTGDDACALRRDFPRLLLYRKLVRDNLERALRDTLTRTCARLGGHFERYFDEFLRLHPPSTRLLKDLTPAFLEFALPRWAKDPEVAPYLSDLARHEALQVRVASELHRPQHDLLAELALDEAVEFILALALVRYDFAVHRLPEDVNSRVLPEQSAVSLLAYRSPEHEVRYLELSVFAAELLSGLLDQRLTLRQALTEAAQKSNLPLDDRLLSGALGLLSDLAERGALLGMTTSRLPCTLDHSPEHTRP